MESGEPCPNCAEGELSDMEHPEEEADFDLVCTACGKGFRKEE